MSQQYVESGLDLEALTCLTKADLMQAINDLTPINGYGLVIFASDAPDVVATPQLAKFIWLKTVADVPNGEIYFFNGTTWTLLGLTNGALLANNSVPLTKISLVGAAALNIIQVNGAGTALIWTSVINAITNGTITLAKLVPGGAGNFFLASLNSVLSYEALSSVVNYLIDFSVPINKLVRGAVSGSGMFLTTKADGSENEYVLFDPNYHIAEGQMLINRLLGLIAIGNPGAPLQGFRRNVGNSGWEWYDTTPVSSLSDYACLQRQLAQGTNGGNVTGGSWQSVGLNTEVFDSGGVVALSGGGPQFIIQPGTHRLEAFSEAWAIPGSVAAPIGSHVLRLQGITDAAKVYEGRNSMPKETGSSAPALATLIAQFTLTVAETFELQRFASATTGFSPAIALGNAANITGRAERYEEVRIYS